MLEKILGLDQVAPMQSSYTQTADDRTAADDVNTDEEVDSGIEPPDDTEAASN